MNMRTFVTGGKGKVYASLGHEGGLKRVSGAGLFVNRLLKPGMGMAAIAEHHVFRLLKGADNEKQLLLVKDLADHKALGRKQAEILIMSGKVTSKDALLLLKRASAGHNGGTIAPGNI